jgi:hypothetical protein
MGGQKVVGEEAIAHRDPAKGVLQQLDRRGGRRAQPLHQQRHHWGDHHPLPAAFAIGIASIRIPEGSTVSST